MSCDESRPVMAYSYKIVSRVKRVGVLVYLPTTLFVMWSRWINVSAKQIVFRVKRVRGSACLAIIVCFV